MTTATELLNELRDEINQYNTAYVAAKSAKREFVNCVADEDNWTEDGEQAAAHKMREAENLRDRLELTLLVKSERAIGKGSELGTFWTTISKMRE
jgi:hypothetical protein